MAKADSIINKVVVSGLDLDLARAQADALNESVRDDELIDEKSLRGLVAYVKWQLKSRKET